MLGEAMIRTGLPTMASTPHYTVENITARLLSVIRMESGGLHRPNTLNSGVFAVFHLGFTCEKGG